MSLVYSSTEADNEEESFYGGAFFINADVSSVTEFNKRCVKAFQTLNEALVK